MPESETERARSGLLRLVSMLGDELDYEEDQFEAVEFGFEDAS